MLLSYKLLLAPVLILTLGKQGFNKLLCLEIRQLLVTRKTLNLSILSIMNGNTDPELYRIGDRSNGNGKYLTL